VAPVFIDAGAVSPPPEAGSLCSGVDFCNLRRDSGSSSQSRGYTWLHSVQCVHRRCTVALLQKEFSMTRKTLTVRIAVALVALLSATLLGAYALQSRQVERELADLPLVRMDPVVVIADRSQAAKARATQVAKNPAITSLR